MTSHFNYSHGSFYTKDSLSDEQNSPGLRESPEKAVPTRRKLLIMVTETWSFVSDSETYRKRVLSMEN